MRKKFIFVILTIFILPFLPSYVSSVEASDISPAETLSPTALSVRNDLAIPNEDITSKFTNEVIDNTRGTAANDRSSSVYANSPYILNPVGSAQYLSSYWNPHQVGLTNAAWSISFGDKVTIFLDNNASEFGHVACGSWWTSDFLNKEKLPLNNVKSLVVSVDVYLSGVSFDAANARLRMAVASAITMSGTSKYTELDFWDSPAAYQLLYPDSKKYFNRSDEYSYNTNQIQSGQWVTLTADYIPYIKASWGDLSQASLESIYMVIESDCRKHQSEDIVSLDVRNLIIRVTE